MKINIQNKAAIEKALNDVQHRCTVELVSHSDLEYLAERAEKHFDGILNKKDQSGARVYERPEGPANAYKYTAHYTKAVIQKGSTGWFLVHVSRDVLNNRCPEKVFLELTEKQQDAACEKLKATKLVAF